MNSPDLTHVAADRQQRLWPVAGGRCVAGKLPLPPRFRITIGRGGGQRSARKHGLADEDAVHAAGRFLVAYPLEDEDQDGLCRELRPGPDRAVNLPEVVVLLLDDGRRTRHPRDADEARVPGPPPVTPDESIMSASPDPDRPQHRGAADEGERADAGTSEQSIDESCTGQLRGSATTSHDRADPNAAS